MRLLVGYDGSDISQKALEFACKQAGILNADILVMTSMVGGPEVPRQEFVRLEKMLAAAQTLVNAAKLQAETLLSVRGLEPGEDLVQCAQENQIDLIVIGIKKRSRVSKMVFGSTAQYTILNAGCPVLTVNANTPGICT